MPPAIPNDILKPSKTDEEKNELEIFGGKTHTVATRSPVVPSSGGLRKANSSGMSMFAIETGCFDMNVDGGFSREPRFIVKGEFGKSEDQTSCSGISTGARTCTWTSASWSSGRNVN